MPERHLPALLALLFGAFPSLIHTVTPRVVFVYYTINMYTLVLKTHLATEAAFARVF